MVRLRAFEGGAASAGNGSDDGTEEDDAAGDRAMGAGTYGIGDDGKKVLRIDCADCAHRRSAVCDDCLVTFLCERESDGAVVVPMAEIRAVRLLQGAGLAPRIRHHVERLA